MKDDVRARYQRVKALLVDVLALPPETRPAFLDDACAGDPELRREVESLLAQESGSRPILDQGPLHTQAGETIRSAIEAIERRQRPREIGGYEIVDVLGEGGMGVVYHGRQHAPIKRDVAIKVIRKGMATDRVIARFEWERRSLARMDHPHIATILDAGADEAGHPYVVMQLAPGEPLTHFCDQRRMDLPTRLQLFLKVCRAVQHAHDRGILHRDLKPSNILVRDVDGVPSPSVIDFGIAKALDPDPETDAFLTAEGQRIGTPAYMSPEQLRGDLGRIDVRSDVYALGIILYELLTGGHPFGETASELDEEARRRREPTRAPSTALERDEHAEALARERGTTVRRLRRMLSGDLDVICLMAIRAEPERRYPSVAALTDDIERYLDGHPVHARPDTLGYRVRKLIRRNPVATALVGAGVAFGIAAAVALVIHAEQLQIERDRARAAEIRATREATSAAEMADFLEGLFTQVDPREGGAGEVTAREILNQGADRVRSDLTGSPVAQARFLNVIADVHHSLGLHQDAFDLSGESLATLAAVAGPDSAVLALRADALSGRSTAAYDLGRIDDAEAYDREGLELRRRVYGERSAEVAYALGNLALVLQAQHRLDEAMPLMRESLEITEETQGRDHPDVMWTRTNLGYMLHRQGRYLEARPQLEAALAAGRRIADGDDVEVANAIHNLAGWYGSMHRFAEAETLIAESHAMYARIYREEHPAMARALVSHGRNRFQLGQVEEGCAMAEEGFAMQLRLLGPDHRHTLRYALAMARCAADLGHPARADSIYRDNLARRRAVHGDGIEVAEARVRYGSFLVEIGDLDRGQAEIKAALVGYETLLGADHPETAEVSHALAVAEVRAGRMAEARPRYEAALANLREHYGVHSPRVERAESDWAEAVLHGTPPRTSP